MHTPTDCGMRYCRYTLFNFKDHPGSTSIGLLLPLPKALLPHVSQEASLAKHN